MAQGYSSQAGHVLLRTQSVQGTFASDLATAGVAIKTTTGALGTNRSLMIPNPEIGGSRDIPDAYAGPVAWAGQYGFYTRLNSFLTLLAAALGTVASPVTSGGVTTQTITGSDGAALPFLSIEEQLGAGLEVFNYTDAVVDKLHLEVTAEGYVTGTADLIAVKQIAGATPTNVASLLDNGNMYVGSNMTLTYNGASLSVKDLKFDIANNFENNDFRVGSLYLGGLVPKRRDVNGSFSYRPSDSSLFRQAVYGASSATQAGGLITKQPLVITMSAYENIPSSTPPTVYSLSLTLPKVVLPPFSLPASGDDVIQQTVNWQALRPTIATPLVTAVAKTDLAIIA